MPTKGRKGHSDVRPGDGHSGNIRFDKTKEGISKNRNVVQVPRILGVLVHRVCLECGHSTGDDMSEMWEQGKDIPTFHGW